MSEVAGEQLRSTRFRRERERSWRRLETLLATVERAGVATLSAEDLARLPALHRTAASSLSVARAVSLDKNLTDYLESLVARSAMIVYGNHTGLRRVSGRFLRAFPARVRASWRPLLLATLLLVGGGVTGFELCTAEPSIYPSIVPESMASGRDFSATRSELRDTLYDDGDMEGFLTTFASFLFQNNARVGMLCFALGFVAGLPVFMLLFWNGMVLGAMTAVFHGQGLAAEWWAWILPHGITELGAVVLCGAAGLQLGHALVFPGRRSRLHEMGRAGRGAAVIVVGSVGMLAFAALIEGYFRQLVHDVDVRYGTAAATAVLWLAYFLIVGRRRGADDGEEPVAALGVAPGDERTRP